MDKNQNYVDYIGIILMTSTLHIKFGFNVHFVCQLFSNPVRYFTFCKHPSTSLLSTKGLKVYQL